MEMRPGSSFVAAFFLPLKGRKKAEGLEWGNGKVRGRALGQKGRRTRCCGSIWAEHNVGGAGARVCWGSGRRSMKRESCVNAANMLIFSVLAVL